ncbi:MAG: RluA family pseudouridine synthase [Firmicutes bacterium]|nr:RluA family pseudouridine synthase [Bacillota bacterium]
MSAEQQGERLELSVDEQDAGLRIDRYLSGRALPSRSLAEKVISAGLVTVNGAKVKPSYRVSPGDLIVVLIPPPQEVEVRPEPISLDIVYEDGDLLVVNKPRGLVVHPGAGHQNRTLVNALLYHCTDLSGIGGELRPGIVHRLDKDTTGLLVVAKNDFAHAALAAMLKDRQIHRWYLAIVRGAPATGEGLIDAPIGRHRIHRQKMAVHQSGRHAVTKYRVLAHYPGYSLVQLKLRTGRTHQIRVHLHFIGTPVVGDQVYGKGPELGLPGQALHACRLRFNHPRTGATIDCFVPPPADFQQAVQTLAPDGFNYEYLALDNWGLDC